MIDPREDGTTDRVDLISAATIGVRDVGESIGN
jgi:hypothetical protein